MSVQAFTGSFVKKTGTGTQSITGVGFTPKAVFFWWNNLTVSGMVNAGARLSFGFDDGTNAVGTAHHSGDAVATTETSRAFSSTDSLLLYNTNETEDSVGRISSMDLDGFTVNWSAAVSASTLIHFLAIGGASVSAKAGFFVSRSGTGSQSVTGVGFQPTGLLFLEELWTTVTAVGTGYGGALLGAAAINGQWSVMAGTVDAVNPADAFRQQVSTLCINKNPTTGNVHEASFTSFDSDGFTVNWSSNAMQGAVPYLALAGVSIRVGRITQPTSTGQQTTTISGLTPSAILFGSIGAAESTSRRTQNRMSIGCASGANQGVIWTADEHNVTPSRGARYRATDAVMIAADTIPADGSTATITARAAFISMSAGQFVLDWTVVDATQREVVYVALAETPSTPYAVTIAAIDRNPLLDTFNIQAPINGIATMRADFESEGSPFFRPDLDDEIVMYENGLPIFGGYVTAIRERGFEGPNGEAIVQEVTASDYKVAAMRRYVNEIIVGGGSPATTLKDVLLVLEAYLTPYGISLDPAQVDGPDMEGQVYEDRLLKDILDELSAITGYVWDIDVHKVFRMYAIGSLAASFDLDESELPAKYFDDITVEPTREQYANRVLLKFGPHGNLEVTDTFFGDGTTDTFTLSAPLTNFSTGVYVARGYVTSDALASPPVNETLSEVGGGGQWEWDDVTNTITRVAGAPALGKVIQIVYVGRFPVTVTVEDAGEIATHGLFELAVNAPEVTSLTLAQSMAATELQKHLTVLRRVTYSTRETSVQPGQTQVFDIPRRDLDMDAVITEVVIESEPGGDLLVRRVTALEGDVVQGDWREIYTQWLA